MEDSNKKIIEQFYQTIAPLKYKKLHFSISPNSPTYCIGWIGALLRNNFMFAAENIPMQNYHGYSFREFIQTPNLNESHPLHTQCKGGLPKGISLQLHNYLNPVSETWIMPDHPIHFSIILYGTFMQYVSECISTIQQMCTNGLGHPKVPFLFKQEIESKSEVNIQDFINRKFRKNENTIVVHLPIPLNLSNNAFKRDDKSTIIHKLGFPEFYPFIRSISDRIGKLASIYVFPDRPDYYLHADALIEPFTSYATSVSFSAVNIQLINLYSTPKERQKKRLRFSGYVGQIEYNGYFNYYLPLLYFAQALGAGHNTAYGLGQFFISKKETFTQ